MGDDHVLVGQRAGNEVVVGDLEKGRDRPRLVVGTDRPPADCLQARDDRGVGLDEESRPGRRPGGQLAAAAGVLLLDPVPERRAEVEAVVEVLGLDEHVRI